MGYVPPPRPHGLLVLPKGVDYLPLKPPPYNPPDGGGGWRRPVLVYETPYRAYLRDLYGEPGRDWLPVLNAAALGCLIALGVALAWLLGG